MKLKRRAVSLLLTMAMILTFMPGMAFAADDETNESSVSKIEKRGALKKDESQLRAQETWYDYGYTGTYSGSPVIEIEDDSEDGYLEYYYYLEPGIGDSISVNVDNTKQVFRWSSDDYLFENSQHGILTFSVYRDGSEYYLDVFNFDSEDAYYDEEDCNWYANIPLNNPTVNNSVTQIVFEPANIAVNCEDITKIYSDGPCYDFDYRVKHSTGSEPWYSPFANGDKITVYFKNASPMTFVNRDIYREMSYGYGYYDDYFVYGDYKLYPDDYNWKLQAGNNTVTISWHGVSTTINVFVDTPEQRAARAAAAEAAANAEWNGVLNKKIPAAKSVKAKAGKKRVTVSWKKASKKNLRKFDKVEIQVCTDKSFQRANTIRKEFKKSKKSATVKGLAKKKTYYVRVRDVKGSGAAKQVSKWSKVKKIKTK